MRKTPIRRISKRMAKQKKAEAELRQRLLIRCGGLCEGYLIDPNHPRHLPDWRGLSKHERIKRSQGGDPLDENNCFMVCGEFHSSQHGIIER